MRSSSVIVAAVAMLSAMSGGDCILSTLLNAAIQTSKSAGKSALDVGSSLYDLASNGGKNVDDLIKFGTDTITDAQKKTYETLNDGHIRLAELVEEGAENFIDLTKQIGSGISDTAYRGGKKLLRTKLDLLKGGFDVVGKTVSGISDTAKTGLKSSVGAILDATPEVPVLKSLARFPYKLVKNKLKSTSRFADTARTNSQNILDTVRPDDD